jgi:phage tail-like protein
MPKVIPLKQFSYSVEIDGLNQFLCQDISLPEMTIDEAEHTEGNFKTRTPGLVALGDLTLSNLKPSDTSDPWAWDWINGVQNPSTGIGLTPDQYQRNVVVRLKDNGGNTIESWEFLDCWPKKALGLSLSKTSSDNIMEEVVLVVNGVNKL